MTLRLLLNQNACLDIRDQNYQLPEDYIKTYTDISVQRAVHNVIRQHTSTCSILFQDAKRNRLSNQCNRYPRQASPSQVRCVSSAIFSCITLLMLSQVTIVFPHIRVEIFKYMLSMSCFVTLATFVLASKSQPGYLKPINSEQANLLTLLKKFEPERVCPTCELVQANNAVHCTSCNRCIVDFDSHSLLVNNCISGNNRQYLILFLMSLLGFFMTLIIISLLHFEKSSSNIYQMFENADDPDNASPKDAANDGPYQTFVVGVFVVSMIAMIPTTMHLRRQCNLYGRTSAILEQQETNRILKQQ